MGRGKRQVREEGLLVEINFWFSSQLVCRIPRIFGKHNPGNFGTWRCAILNLNSGIRHIESFVLLFYLGYYAYSTLPFSKTKPTNTTGWLVQHQCQNDTAAIMKSKSKAQNTIISETRLAAELLGSVSPVHRQSDTSTTEQICADRLAKQKTTSKFRGDLH